MAQAGGLDLDQHLAGAGRVELDLLDRERAAFGIGLGGPICRRTAALIFMMVRFLPVRRILDAAAAVDFHGDAGDEFRLVGGKPQRGAGDVGGVLNRPSGMEARNRARVSGSSRPMKAGRSGVSPATGHRQLTRIWPAASSTAIDLVMVMTAPLVELYR